MQFLLLIGLIVLGFTFGKLGWLQQRQISWGNKYIIYVALPVVALAKIPGIRLDAEISLFILIPVGIFFGSMLVFQLLLRRFISPDERLVLSLTSGLGNTSFIGFPLIIFYFGADFLSYGALFDQTTFLLMASVGQAMIVRTGGWSGVILTLRKVITFPVFLAIVVAFLLPSELFGESVLMVFDWIIQSLSIVAMLIVGFLIARFVSFPFPNKVWLGLGYKLVFVPLIVWITLKWIDIPDVMEHVSLLESSMAPQTSICLMLLENNKLPALVSQILCWGTLFSLAASYIWIVI